MRSYLIEDFYPEQLDTLLTAFKEMGLSGSLDGIFYLPLPKNLLTDVQLAHQDECGPHIMVLEVVDEGAVKLELLVRAQNKLRCECVAYATPAQREHMISYLDDILRQLDISL